MRTFRHQNLLLTLLLGIALLMTHGVGGHLHLCFDGQEPAVSMHAADGDHAEHQSISGHNDQNIELSSVVIAKLWSQSLDSAALLFVVTALLFFALPNLPRTPFGISFALGASPKFLHPPLRGPPL